MYILKNAVKSISRNKGRNILLGIIIVVIACACTISLAILNASDKLIKSVEDKYEVEATISMNRDNLMKDFKPGESDKEQMKENFSNIESLTSEEIENYGNSDYVKEYYYTKSINVDASELEKASNDVGSDRGRGGPNNEIESADFSLVGYNSIDSMSDFINGTHTIIDGEVSNDFESNSVAINEELTTLNDISVDDEITLVSPNDEDITYKVKVTGIFKENLIVKI